MINNEGPAWLADRGSGFVIRHFPPNPRLSTSERGRIKRDAFFVCLALGRTHNIQTEAFCVPGTYLRDALPMSNPSHPDDDPRGVYRMASEPAWPPPIPVAEFADDQPAIPYALPAEDAGSVPLAIPVDEGIPTAQPEPVRRQRPRPTLDVLPVVPGPNVLFALLWWVGFFAVDLMFAVTLGIVFRIRNQQPDLVTIFGLSQFVHLLMAGTVVAVMYRRFARVNLGLGGINPWHAFLVLLLVFPLHIVGAEAASWVVTLMQFLVKNLHLRVPFRGQDELMEPLAQAGLPIMLLIIAVLPGLAEELFFRGFLGRGLVARHGVAVGLGCTTLFFAVMHIIPPQVCFTLILGLGIHIVYLTTKSLWLAILLHMGNNTLACVMYVAARDLRQQVPWIGFWRDGNTHLPPLLVFASLAAAVMLLWLFYANRMQWIMPDGGVWSPGYVSAETPPAAVAAEKQMLLPGLPVATGALLAYAVFLGVLVWEIGLWR